jgi:hypothetical protein
MNDRSDSMSPLSSLNAAIRPIAARTRLPLEASIPSTLQSLLAGLIVLFSVSQAFCQISCKPILTVKEVRFSDVKLLHRTWTAVLLVDASHCATSSGWFEIDFVRLKEISPDLQFTERFTWKPGRIEISVDFWADEAVLDYRIGFIAPCVCRDLPLR